MTATCAVVIASSAFCLSSILDQQHENFPLPPVGANRPLVTSMEKSIVTKVCDDEREVATSWADVVCKKKPSRLVGKQSDAMLTLFTKSKIVN